MNNIKAKPMRKLERKLDESATRAVLSSGTYGVLAINDAQGAAYSVPLNYVYKDDAVYFHCAPEGEKLRLLARDNRVTFCVVTQAEVLKDAFSTRYASVIVYGEVMQLTDRAEKLSALIGLIDAFSSDEDYRARGRAYAEADCDKTTVLKLTISDRSGKSRK